MVERIKVSLLTIELIKEQADKHDCFSQRSQQINQLFLTDKGEGKRSL